MSKSDMLAPIIRALVGVPQDRLGVILDAVNKIGGTDGDLWRTRIGQVLREGVRSAVASAYPTYTVAVNGDLSLSEAIAAGEYDDVNDNITAEHFPVSYASTKTVNIALVHRNRVVQSEDIFAEMDREGYRPATIWELLALGAEYPDLQRNFTIFALGSIAIVGMDGFKGVVYLGHWRKKRGINLLLLHLPWHRCARFAFVRKD